MRAGHLAMTIRGHRAFMLAVGATVLSFVLAWHLADPLPFTAVAPVAVAGKWWENVAERKHNK